MCALGVSTSTLAATRQSRLSVRPSVSPRSLRSVSAMGVGSEEEEEEEEAGRVDSARLEGRGKNCFFRGGGGGERDSQRGRKERG